MIHVRCLMEETTSTFENFETDVKDETTTNKSVINAYTGIWWLNHGFEYLPDRKEEENKLRRARKVQGFCKEHKPAWNHNCHCKTVGLTKTEETMACCDFCN